MEVRRGLAEILGTGGTRVPSGTEIPASEHAAELDIAVLWNWEGGQEEAEFYNVPCSFSYPYTGWTVGKWVGYNAGSENQQEKNPSYWVQYDEHEDE